MLHALPIAQRRAGTIQRQSDHNPQALNAVSQNIVQAFDTRPYLLHTTRAAADIAPKTWLQQLQTYAAQHGFAKEFERVWTTESWPMKRVAAFQVETFAKFPKIP